MNTKKILLLLLLLSVGFAQEIKGNLAEIQIIGDKDNATIIKTLLHSRKGTDVESIDLESERNLVLSIGLFSKVVVRLEKQANGPVLVVEVEPNPRIGSVSLEGSSLLKGEQSEEFFRRNLIEVGATLNTARTDELIQKIIVLYRQQGFPFNVDVALKVSESDKIVDGRKSVDIVYTVDEAAKVSDVEAENCTVLEPKQITDIFQPLVRNKKFDFELYKTLVQNVDKKYFDLGYRGSGIDNTGKTQLDDGLLNLVCRELRVSSIDTKAIGVDADEISFKVGDLFNYDLLLKDAKRLSNELNMDVNFEPPYPIGNSVRVRFKAGPPEKAGKIEKIEIVGNSVIDSDELISTLGLKVGDNFSSAIATEDFNKIYEIYDSKGYIMAKQAQFNFLDGVYSQSIIEIKIAGYEVEFAKEKHKSKEFLLTRYLPKVGSVFNRDSFGAGLRSALRLGAFEIAKQPEFKPAPGKPDEVIVVVSLKELSTTSIIPEMTYTIGSGVTTVETGFVAHATYSDKNFLGRGHTAGASLSAKTSDIGFLLGGSLNYSIPWLYIDEFDFKEIPTRMSFSLFSEFNANQAMSGKDGVKICLDPDKREKNDCSDENKVLIGDYTQRSTGFAASLGRRVAPYTNLGVSARFAYNNYTLEPVKKCKVDGEGKITNLADCNLPENEALEFLPQDGMASKIGTSIDYDDRDNPNYPRDGVHADASIAFGFGNDYRNPSTKLAQGYVYMPVQFGARTYVQIDEQDPNHVIAVKFTAGHQFGGEYPKDRYFVVGDSATNSTLIRGFTRDDINPSQSYAITSLEYRYDFGLDSVATKTVIGYAFVDLGWASQMPGFNDYETPLLAGTGLGVQLNLGFGSFILPAVRLDYSFSDRQPSGIFRFRIGPVF